MSQTLRVCNIGLSALFLLASPAALASRHGAVTTTNAHADDFSTHTELLDALEKAESGLATLSAEVTRVKLSAIGGEDQIWRGKLHYVIDQPATPTTPAKRRFAVRFDSLQIGSRVHERVQEYIFDGRVLIERLPDEKLQTERVIVGPGEDFDPMAVGEGRLPIPIGQRASDIEARYELTLLPADADLDPDADATLIELTRDAYQLRLIPKTEFAREESFAQIRLWYDKATLLPVLSRTQGHLEEEQETILLRNPVKNEPGGVAAKILDPRAPEGWRVQVVEWRGKAGAEADAGGANPAEGEPIEFQAEFKGPIVKPAPDSPTVPASPGANEPK